MKINKAFKFIIYPNSQQKQFLAQSFGCVSLYTTAFYVNVLTTMLKIVRG